jgi:hypothetical protein
MFGWICKYDLIWVYEKQSKSKPHSSERDDSRSIRSCPAEYPTELNRILSSLKVQWQRAPFSNRVSHLLTVMKRFLHITIS